MRQREKLACPGHRYIEEASFVIFGTLVARLVEESCGYAPVASSAGHAAGETAVREGRHKDEGPLKTLGLVDRGQIDGIKIDGLLAFKPFVGTLRPVLHVGSKPAVVGLATISGAPLLAWSIAIGP